MLCINKIDMVEKKESLLEVIAAYNEVYDGFDAIIPLSARTGDGLDELLRQLETYAHYSSGQVPLDPATGAVVGTTIEEQTEQVMKNLGALLKAAGVSYENVVKTTCFLADMGDFGKFNEIYARYFTGKPARSCVAVKTLPKNVLCEVEVIAEV